MIVESIILDSIIKFIAGCVAGGIAVHFFEKRNCDNVNFKDNDIQTGGGDFAGRDMNKNV